LRPRRLKGRIARMLANQRDLFDVPADVSYFNTANLSPLLRSVREAAARGIDVRAAPWDIAAVDWFTDVERLRGLAARLVGASPEDMALVPATSYGLAVAARNLPLAAGDRVLVLDQEFPSGYYTWQRQTARSGAELLVVRREAGQSWTDAVLAALDDRVAVVAVPNVHWTDGAPVELERVAPAARAAGAALVVDASQSLGAMPLDVGRLEPDFLVSVGYKWQLGPFGVGYLYVAPRHRDGEPLENNWILREGSDDFAALADYTDRYLPGARRFDVGERTNFELVPMAIAALEQILAWGVDEVAASLRAVNDDIARRAEPLGLTAPAVRAPHMIGLEFPPGDRERLVEGLRAAGVVAAVRAGVLRVSPHLHTTPADVERLIGALAGRGVRPLVANTTTEVWEGRGLTP
jgi:selenocysteine lyase/cysteine desulfurase